MAQEISKRLILNMLKIDFKLKELLDDKYTEIQLNELTDSNAVDVIAVIARGSMRNIQDKHSLDELIETLPNLRVVALPGTGYEHINLKLTKSKGILVGNCPHSFSKETADFALTLLLAVTRKLIPAVSLNNKSGGSTYTSIFDKFLSVPIAGSKLGIVGMGSVGFEVAKRARGFDMSVLYHNRKKRADESEVGAEYFPLLKHMLPLCDFLVLAVRASEETHLLIGKEELAQLKPTCILINIARSSVIDQDALVTALKEGRLGGAGLDTTEPRDLPSDHDLLKMENVIATPHIAWAGVRGVRQACQDVADNLRAGIEGKPLPYPVE